MMLVTFPALFVLGSVSFVLFRGINFITPDHYSLSEKLVAALAETIADKNTKQWNIYSPAHISPNIFNLHGKNNTSHR